MDRLADLAAFQDISWSGQAWYALAWLSFGLGHTLLAGAGAKDALKPMLGAYYRAAYNLVAVVHLFVVAWVGRAVLSDFPFSQGFGHEAGQLAMFALGCLLFAVSIRSYDLGLLGGITQIKRAQAGLPEEDEQPLTLEGAHRWVRHPLYAAGFLILWGRATDEFGLATALWGSVYLILGTMAEERRLIARFGDTYIAYRKRVPAFVPWRGRAWNP